MDTPSPTLRVTRVRYRVTPDGETVAIPLPDERHAPVSVDTPERPVEEPEPLLHTGLYL